jgi:hypothetical protein
MWSKRIPFVTDYATENRCRFSFIIFLFSLISINIFLPNNSYGDSTKIYNPNNGHYYQRIDTATSWLNAKAYCENLGGHLVTITSQAENDFIYNALGVGHGTIWIGGFFDLPSNQWRWVTDEPWVYQNWEAGQPDGYNNQNYANFWGGHSGRWDNDGPPDWPNRYYVFICEWGPTCDLSTALDNNKLSFTTEGDANWYGQSETFFYDGFAGKSGFIIDGQSSYLSTTVQGPGTLSFYWKVSSESGYDFLMFYIDGTLQPGKISGNVDWVKNTISIPSGSHTLKWQYSKNGSQSKGCDSAWVDKVEYLGNPSPPPPVLLAPSNNVTQVDPNNILFQWQPCTDPDGDAVEYFICVREFGPDDNNVVKSYTSGNNYSASLQANKIYDWAVWAKDSNGNYSEASEKFVFSTKIDENNLLAYFNGLGYDVNYFSYESIYSIVRNCIQYEDYVYQQRDLFTWVAPWEQSYQWGKLQVNIDANWRNIIRSSASYDNNPIGIFYQINDKPRITSRLDASWGNEINGDSHFNTVYAALLGNTIGSKFEVISERDEIGPFTSTENLKCYYFTYDGKNDENGCVTIESWTNYLAEIKNKYNRPIDILTIYAHGGAGHLHISDLFLLDSSKLEKMKALRNILSNNAIILLFSCSVGQDERFVQDLANATRAIVYANKQKTGNVTYKGGACIQDWELDVVKRPQYSLSNIISLLLQE